MKINFFSVFEISLFCNSFIIPFVVLVTFAFGIGVIFKADFEIASNHFLVGMSVNLGKEVAEAY